MDNETKQKFIDLDRQIKELRLFGENLQRENQNLTNELRSLKQKDNSVELKKDTYDYLRVYRLFGGIPIYTTTTNLKGFPGQHVLVHSKDNTTPRKLVGYSIDNTVSYATLT